ncbi:MAG: YggS family pyridoxal phosphate-dependent enzyme [Deltaproteobacteria bacterium]|nr:YggS family pyridoxal phosphate-dependent enzyme [Deltaproteobacteria bacterium]
MTEIAQNIAHIRAKMALALSRAGRNPGAVRLMAVTKSVTTDKIAQAVLAGIDAIGENYLQEAQNKFGTISTAPALHFIGHLQTNKAKHAVAMFDMIHSVGKIELAREINKRARSLGKVQDVLLEINLGAEESKQGLAPGEAGELLSAMADWENVRVRGLMAIPPPDGSAKYFGRLRDLACELRLLNLSNAPLDELSMGMSDDYEEAIAAGATIIRIGRGIFGERPPK